MTEPTNTWANSTAMPRVGDYFTMDVPVRRKWWAFWRPRYTMARRTFKVTASTS